MSTQVGKLMRNKIVKDFNGNIIDWFDEANGGWIVQKRQIVNEERWNQHLQKQKDKLEAASAVAKAKIRDDYPQNAPGNNASDKVKELETKVNAMDSKLDAILNAMKK